MAHKSLYTACVESDNRKLREKMNWKLILHTIPAEHREALLEYCQLAQNQDTTFKFKVEGKYVIIKCPDRNIAYRRGQIFHYRFGCYYEVEKME